MGISDWRSDVCSSDLRRKRGVGIGQQGLGGLRAKGFVPAFGKLADLGVEIGAAAVPVVHAVRVEPEGARTSVVSDKSVSVRVGLGGRRSLTKQTPSQRS